MRPVEHQLKHRSKRTGGLGQRPSVLLWCLLAALSQFALPQTAAQAAPPAPKRMPAYQATGELTSDPAVVSQERKLFDAARERFNQAKSDNDRDAIVVQVDEPGGKHGPVLAAYDARIDVNDAKQFDLRRAEITRLESAILAARDGDLDTPDALFRLGELYHQDSIVAHNRALAAFPGELELYRRGKRADPPDDPKLDLSRSIAVYQYLHWVPEGTAMAPLTGKFAGVVLKDNEAWRRRAGVSDAAMYLHGFCAYEMRERDPDAGRKAIATLTSLEAQYPSSGYAGKAWLRIGDIHMDTAAYDQAALAYEHAATNAKVAGGGVHGALALYKLGMANFRRHAMPAAVRSFQQAIDADSEVRARASVDGKVAMRDAHDLRQMAVAAIAKVLAEPDWDGDGCEDFGAQAAKAGCPIVDPRARPALYTASVLEVELQGEAANWAAPFRGGVLARLQGNLAARGEVRAGFGAAKAYAFDVQRAYGLELYDQRKVDSYGQAIRVLGHAVGHHPMKREAEELQRKLITALGIWETLWRPRDAEFEVGKHKNKDDLIREALASEADFRGLAERRVYLDKFGKGSEWYKKWGADKTLADRVAGMTHDIRRDFAMLSHGEAQRLQGEGKVDEAIAKYAETAVAYELALSANIDPAKAYRLTWNLAEVWYLAGTRCDAPRASWGKLILVDDDVVPWPLEKLPEIRQACVAKGKSIAQYNKVREWPGDRGKDDDGKPMDKTEEAAYLAIGAAEQMLAARAAYPKDDPEHVPTSSLPEIRPNVDRDNEVVRAHETANMSGVQRLPRVPLAPAAVEWILAVDDYVARGDKFQSKDDPDRAAKLALKAAELLYKNRHFDPWQEGATKRTAAEFWSARRRFEAILKRFSGTKFASEAVKDLITSFWLENDIDGVQVVIEKYQDQILESMRPRCCGGIRCDPHEPIKFNALSDRAFNRFKAGEADQATAAKAATPQEAAKMLVEARKKFALAAGDFREVRQDILKIEKMHPSERIKLSRQALLNAVRAYHHAELWDKCIDTLGEAEKMLREWDPTDPKEKADRTAGLAEVLEIRANLAIEFFRTDDAIQDLVALYHNDPKGKKAEYYLKTAAQIAYFNHDWERAIPLTKQVIARFGKDRAENTQRVVKDAMWQLYDIDKARKNVPGQIAALGAFIARYHTDKATSQGVFRAYALLAELHASKGDMAAATRTYHRTRAAFTISSHTGDGGAEATVAAQAAFELLRPQYDAGLATKLVENKALPEKQRLRDLLNQARRLADIVFGPQVQFKAPDGTSTAGRCGQCPLGNQQCRDAVCSADPKKNGLYDQYLTVVAAYGSQHWSYAAALYRARLLLDFADKLGETRWPQTGDDGLKLAESGTPMAPTVLRASAIQVLKLALTDADAKVVANPWVHEIRRELNRLLPKEFPHLRDAKHIDANPPGTLPQVERELR